MKPHALFSPTGVHLLSCVWLAFAGCRHEDPTPTSTPHTGAIHTGATATGDTAGAPTDTGSPAAWWFQVIGTGQVQVTGACAFADPREETGWDPSWTAVVGWFDGTATFAAGAPGEAALTADGVDGFLAVLDPDQALHRLVLLGGPGDQRVALCSGADGLFLAGTFGGTLSVTDLGDTLTATSPSDAFQYWERSADVGSGAVWDASLTHVVAGEVADLFFTQSLFEHRLFGTFAGAITVWPGTPEAWSATSGGDLDAFFARPSRPLLVTGPGRETLRAVFPWASSAGPGTFHVDRTWIVGSASAGARVVADGVETPIPATFGDRDAWSGDHGGPLDDADGAFAISVHGGPGPDEALEVAYVPPGFPGAATGTYLAGTFDSGAEGTSVPWGGLDLVGVGGVDVVWWREEDHEVAEALVVGGPGEDTVTHSSFSRRHVSLGTTLIQGGIAAGRFAEGPFGAPGLPSLEACGDVSTWVLTFDYASETGFAPSWLGRGCNLEIEVFSAWPGDASAYVVASHGQRASLELPIGVVVPPDPPAGGAGAFMAVWRP